DGSAVVGADVVGRDAEILGAVKQAQDLGIAQQCLAGYAAPVEAHAAERVALHDGRLQPELSGADGGHVAAGATAYDDDVVIGAGRVTHQYTLLAWLMSPCMIPLERA